jgi:Cys-rich repeat protein
MTYRRAVASLVASLSLVVAGCPTPEPDPTPDAFRVRLDGGTDAFEVPDAPPDDTGPDVGMDAPFVAPPDAFGPPDPAFVEGDAGPCGVVDEDAALSRCACLDFGPDCASAACPTGLVCVDDGCGQHCQRSGPTCSGPLDCPAGATCTPTELGSVCVRSTPGCTSSLDCPAGFSCDAGVCVDRRIGCTASDFVLTCPFNFVCETSLGAPFCVRGMPRCTSDAGCRVGQRCVDVEGDGALECVGDGLCDALADCAGMDGTCGVEPSRLSFECLPAGLCERNADCPPGRSCLDLWGDGQSECVRAGGSCDAQTDCAAGELCASPYEGGSPRCIQVPLSP